MTSTLGLGVQFPAAATPQASFNPKPPDETYVAQAVHFDGLTHLLNEAMKATDTNYINYSIWVKITRVAINQNATAWAVIFDDPPTSNLSTALFFDDGPNWELDGYFTNTAATGTFFSFSSDQSVFFSYDTWHHILLAADGSTGTPVVKTYVDDVDIGATSAHSGAALPFLIGISGFAMSVGTDMINDGGDYTGDMADLWIGNQNLLVAGDIPLATRRLFITSDGRPVNPAHFPSALVLLTGDASEFPVNKGSGGSFAVTGTLTNSTTSPSDVPAPGYEAYAVHFDGATALKNTALVATDNGNVSMSGWFKFDADITSTAPTLWVVDPEGGYLAFVDLTTSPDGNSYGWSSVVALDAGLTAYQLENYLGNIPPGPGPLISGIWCHLLFSIEVNTTPKRFKLYVNDIAVTTVPTNFGPAFVAAFNGLPFWIGLDGALHDELKGDVADLWIAPGVSLLDADGNIPEGTRRRFITAEGKPANPVNWPIAAVMLSGNALMFSTNRGTGGPFAVTGALTDATTSPSQPYPAPAVHFDGATVLTNASLIATNTNFLTVSFWIKITNVAGDFPVPWSTDPAGSLYSEIFFEDDAGGNWKIWQSARGLAGPEVFQINTDTYPVAQSTWSHVLVGIDTSGATKAKIYVDDVDIAYSGVPAIPFLIAVAALPMVVGSDLIAGDYMIGDFADFWFSNSNILDVNGDIPESTRRLFIDADGKPVNPITATAQLGIPVVLFVGDATIFGTDRGTGGAFTTTGTLTNASTSPSD